MMNYRRYWFILVVVQKGLIRMLYVEQLWEMSVESNGPMDHTHSCIALLRDKGVRV